MQHLQYLQRFFSCILLLAGRSAAFQNILKNDGRTDMDEILHIKNLSKCYGDTKVLKNINISVKKGEVVVIIGPSGCGKSTLLEKFKAVKEGHVYCTTKNLYQSTMELGTITSDIRKMLTGDDADLTYLYKVE